MTPSLRKTMLAALIMGMGIPQAATAADEDLIRRIESLSRELQQLKDQVQANDRKATKAVEEVKGQTAAAGIEDGVVYAGCLIYDHQHVVCMNSLESVRLFRPRRLEPEVARHREPRGRRGLGAARPVAWRASARRPASNCSAGSSTAAG